MCTFGIRMKTCLCLLAIVVVIVYVTGENCPSGHATACTLTKCTGLEWFLGCLDNLCTCTHIDGGSKDCTSNSDCGGSHSCEEDQHWRCVHGTCHCITND